MDEIICRQQVVLTGKELLSKGLVARTWGNVSCRLTEDSFLITPSGLDYTKTTEDDIVKMYFSGEFEGTRKPSSERGVHLAAYQVFPDVNFVIHTHQNAASAISLTGIGALDITQSERERLGGIAVAEYGLPGTGKLRDNVRKSLEGGARVVLMEKHGALICGADRADAMEKAAVLEEICLRNLKGVSGKADDADEGLAGLKALIPEAELCSTPAAVEFSGLNIPLRAQLDDMAQMIGRSIPTASGCEQATGMLSSVNAVIIPNIGIAVRGKDEDDTEALKLLCHKSALCALHTRNMRVRSKVSLPHVWLMHLVYLKKYSKQKG